MLQRLLTLGAVFVGWFTLSGYCALFGYGRILHVQRILSTTTLIELPSYGILIFSHFYELQKIAIIIGVIALLRFVLVLIEPIEKLSVINFWRSTWYANIANSLSALLSARFFIKLLSIVQIFIITLLYWRGAIDGLSYGNVLADDARYGFPAEEVNNHPLLSYTYVRVKDPEILGHDFRLLNSLKLLRIAWESDQKVNIVGTNTLCDRHRELHHGDPLLTFVSGPYPKDVAESKNCTQFNSWEISKTELLEVQSQIQAWNKGEMQKEVKGNLDLLSNLELLAGSIVLILLLCGISMYVLNQIPRLGLLHRPRLVRLLLGSLFNILLSIYRKRTFDRAYFDLDEIFTLLPQYLCLDILEKASQDQDILLHIHEPLASTSVLLCSEKIKGMMKVTKLVLRQTR